jgi:hypothetical protein
MDNATARLTATVSIACLVGLGIGYIDTRPTWDDAGVMAGALLIAGALVGGAAPRWCWLSGLALGLPVLALNVATHANYGSALAIGISLIGAGIGAVIGKLVAGMSPDELEETQAHRPRR